MEPYNITVAPFKVVISFSVSREKPRHWYTYNDKTNTKDIRIVSLEKTIFNNDLSAYRVCVGPFSLTVGW